MIDGFSVLAILDADLDLRKFVQDVQLRESDRSVAVDLKTDKIKFYFIGTIQNLIERNCNGNYP